MRVLRYRQWGAGRFRGGDGIERDLLFLEDVTVSLISERRVLQPWGLHGGEPGATGENWVRPGGYERLAKRLPDKCTIRLKAGDVLRMLTPGGGGWGPASARQVEPLELVGVGRSSLCDTGRVGASGDRYDLIGASYARTRREDPRIAAVLHDCLGVGRRVVNVGAGSGSYEPPEREVVAVEPSIQMLRQRPRGAAPAVRGVAEHLPFPDATFDVAMAVLTVHHWADPALGLREMRRVARRQVVFFFEPLRTHRFWALEYFPAALELPTEQDPPGERLLAAHLEIREVRPALVPSDCQDGFGAAFWARPEAYLDPDVQAGMSWLAMLSAEARSEGAGRLRADLASGDWDRRHGHLREQAEFDGGYRIAIAH